MARVQPSHTTGPGRSPSLVTGSNVTSQNGDFILPLGQGDSRQFVLEEDQIFILGCSGTQFASDGSTSMKTGLCLNGKLLVEDEDVGSSLADFDCNHQPYYEANKIGERTPNKRMICFKYRQAPVARTERRISSRSTST